MKIAPVFPTSVTVRFHINCPGYCLLYTYPSVIDVHAYIEIGFYVKKNEGAP